MYTVLAIDDDKTTLGLLDMQLSGLGFTVSTVTSAAKGIDIAKSFNPDVILLDIMMPVMDGFSALTALRRDKSTRDIPVIMLTSNKERETVIEAMRHGVIDYIVKPHNPERLAGKIESAIRYREMKRQQDDDTFIEVNHRADMALIIMKGDITTRGFQNEAKTVFNAFFLKQVNGKICAFDLRGLEELTETGIKELVSVLSMFKGSIIKIVAGKHYGEIVSMTDIEAFAELFLSYGDLELSMRS